MGRVRETAEEGRRKADRKAQLAALPRCTAKGCNRRGAWHVGYARVLLCAAHKRKVEGHNRAMSAQAGILGLLSGAAASAEQILDWANFDEGG